MNVALVEVFRSVQGEGYHAGRPAIFVRFSGCNLSCVFAEGSVCDTPYQQAVIKTDVDGLWDHITPLFKSSYASPVGDEESMMLILTGGEPTLAPAFDAVAYDAAQRGFYVAVETNGTKWRDGLMWCHWITVSPKYGIPQGSPAPFHNHNPQTPALNAEVVRRLEKFQHQPSGEYRFVIGSRNAPQPPYMGAFRHYVSPAVKSDGAGTEWRTGWPGFVPGALERCLEIVQDDPRWRISVQQHKQWSVR